jgi:hypothetical protein
LSSKQFARRIHAILQFAERKTPFMDAKAAAWFMPLMYMYENIFCPACLDGPGGDRLRKYQRHDPSSCEWTDVAAAVAEHDE